MVPLRWRHKPRLVTGEKARPGRLDEIPALGSMSGSGNSYPKRAEDLVGGGCLAEPLLEQVERAGMGLVAVGLTGVGTTIVLC
jgi:hypothetical protein